MGLAAVHGIVRRLRGTIEIASQVGRGTTIQIWLPCAETTADPAHKSMSIAGDSSLCSHLVLVVEDEDPLRQAVIGMLRKRGFSVIAAADGAAAIEFLRADPGKIDVMLLDMTIPGASSHEVVAEAAQTRPDMRVILTSAYSQEMIMSSMTTSQIHGFIRKPYLLSDLVQTLRTAASS